MNVRIRYGWANRRAEFCRPLLLLLAALSLAAATAANGAGEIAAVDVAPQGRSIVPFDAGWRFHLGDLPPAAREEFDDGSWRQLDVPHDWSIEGKFAEEHPTGRAGGYLPAGVGWYRKEFVLPEAARGRRVVVEFDGIMANSDVWINGRKLGQRPYGYVSFHYELTDHVRCGEAQPNVLAVRVDNSRQPASRWYTGAGIYRHVRLVVTDPLHVVPAGLFVATPEVGAERATVNVTIEAANQADAPREFTLETRVVDPAGRVVAMTSSNERLSAQQNREFHHELEILDPERWDLSNPRVYRAVTRLVAGDQLADEVATPFGIRRSEFRADSGYWLNDHNVKIKGVCLHHDGGAVGAAVPLAVWERRLVELQKLGVNAVRTAHNPPAPEFLDLCDRLGVLVMVELFDCWTKGKNRYDYHLYFDEWSAVDARDTIRRDRNHPSVILYSVGNEIRDTPDAELAKRILRELVDVCHESDPTRPVTQGLFRPNVSHDYDNGLADLLDVIGTNYRDLELLAAWRDDPSRKIIGTEQAHDRQIWLAARDHPQHAGQFLWVGVDYLGESPGWPVTTFNAGLLDRTGARYPRAFERQSWWSDRPVVAVMRRIAPTEDTPVDPGYETVEWRRRPVLFPDWTPRELTPHEENVEVYSNCEEVELQLNGTSLGTKRLPPDGRPRNWRVEFEPGTLTAVARNGGQVVATDQLRTAGEPAQVKLTASRRTLTTAWDDVAFVEAEIVDEDGVRVPRANHLVTFGVAGPGRIIAVDNGSIASHEPFQATERRAFDGRCIALVRATASTGRIVVAAESGALAPGEVQIEAAPR